MLSIHSAQQINDAFINLIYHGFASYEIPDKCIWVCVSLCVLLQQQEMLGDNQFDIMDAFVEFYGILQSNKLMEIMKEATTNE